MAQRSILHLNDLNAFKTFLISRGIPYRDGRGYYQVLQVLTKDHGWQCIYKKLDAKEHYSVQEKLFYLVVEFYRRKKGKDAR